MIGLFTCFDKHTLVCINNCLILIPYQKYTIIHDIVFLRIIENRKNNPHHTRILSPYCSHNFLTILVLLTFYFAERGQTIYMFSCMEVKLNVVLCDLPLYLCREGQIVCRWICAISSSSPFQCVICLRNGEN